MSLQTPTTIRARQWKLISQGEDASRPRVSSLDTSIKRPTIVGLAVKPIESRVPEIGAFGLMSGDGKESVGLSPQATAPILNSTTAPFGDESEGLVCWGRDAVVRGGAGSDGGSSEPGRMRQPPLASPIASRKHATCA